MPTLGKCSFSLTAASCGCLRMFLDVVLLIDSDIAVVLTIPAIVTDAFEV